MVNVNRDDALNNGMASNIFANNTQRFNYKLICLNNNYFYPFIIINIGQFIKL